MTAPRRVPEIRKREFGDLADGRKVFESILDNGLGMTVCVLNLGGIASAIHAPDCAGQTANVVLGLPYIESNPFFGIIAGRLANRIAWGRFEIDGKSYGPDTNDGPNTLHGGSLGFGTQRWDIEPEPASAESVSLRLSRVSEDGESGFPGRLAVAAIRGG